MAHLCVPQNQALGVCRGFVPDIQICGTHGRKNLVNATIISNAEGEERRKAVTNQLSVTLSFFGFFVFCVPQLYLWGSPLLGEIFTYVTVF